MSKKHIAFSLAVFALLTGTCAAGEGVNLLPNPGFEKDADGDGIADGWVAQKFNFSGQTLQEVQAVIDDLPPYEELLQGDKILAADGTVLYHRQGDGSWEQDVLGTDSHWGDNERHWKPEENWHETLRNEYLWQHARFGEPPLPEDLDLGALRVLAVTCHSPGIASTVSWTFRTQRRMCRAFMIVFMGAK